MLRNLVLRALRKLPHDTIEGNTGPYLTRYVLLSLGKNLVRVKIHQFHRGDEDLEYHNHPWKWAFSIILRGSYREMRRNFAHGNAFERDLRPGNINLIDENVFHRVELLSDEVWTLFVTGPEVGRWFFMDPQTREMWYWRDFIRLKGLVPLVEA